MKGRKYTHLEPYVAVDSDYSRQKQVCCGEKAKKVTQQKEASPDKANVN